ncbi:hypothetical protein Syun_021116 [Stephania yunnanensis]|uniref:Uncharacterized protein n=1 Tax=Stephania yunnanensis TaxID=152371 RepID=A0AAP0IF39_9MAGN
MSLYKPLKVLFAGDHIYMTESGFDIAEMYNQFSGKKKLLFKGTSSSMPVRCFASILKFSAFISISWIATSGGFAVTICRRLEPPKPLPIALFRRFPKPSPLFVAPQAVAVVCRTLSRRRCSPYFVAILGNYEAAKVGFGASKNMKTSIARAVYDCPFIDGGIKRVEVKERSQVFYNVDTFMLDDHDAKKSSVLEVPNMLPNLKEGVHVALPKVIDVPFIVDISKGDGIT